MLNTKEHLGYFLHLGLLTVFHAQVAYACTMFFFIHLAFHRQCFCVFHPCHLVTRFPVQRFPFSLYQSPHCFHARRANSDSGKIRTCTEYASFAPFSSGTPSLNGTKFRHNLKLVAALIHREDFVILACTVLIGLQSVTDGRTDGRLAKTREASYAVARKKTPKAHTS